LFDTTYQVLELQALEADDAIQLIAVVGSIIPTPQGPAPFPNGVIRFGVSKEVALNHAKRITEIAETLPDTPKPSDIVIAGDVASANKAAETVKRFAG
jgi:hypothetical protein